MLREVRLAVGCRLDAEAAVVGQVDDIQYKRVMGYIDQVRTY